jgi:CubicO group peptidase (beta-lactamase class C family)
LAEFSRVERALREGSGVQFSGAVARIEHRGRVVFERAYGVTRVDELAQPVHVDTPFDLASLTKVFVSTLALYAVAQRKLGLD